MKKNWIIILVVVIALVGAGLFILFNWSQSPSGYFWEQTHLQLPASATNIHDFSDRGSIFDDGTEEFSFYASSSDIQKILQSKPFGQTWIKGALPKDELCPYSTDPAEANCTDTINKFWGPDNTLQFNNSPDLMSVLIDRTKPGDPPLSDYTRIIVDPDNNWVLVITFFL